MDERQHVLRVFTFGCSLCGAFPRHLILRDYIAGWSLADKSRLASLLACLTGALADLRLGAPYRKGKNAPPRPTWISREFSESTEVLAEILRQVAAEFPFPSLPGLTMSSADGVRLVFPMRCPSCERPPGPRRPGKYFDHWRRASKVQVANILYDCALILYGLIGELPGYLSGKALSSLDLLRKGLKYCLTQISLSECPVCGRFTTTLYWEEGKPPGLFCRWCMEEAQIEMGAGRGFFGIGLEMTEGWFGREFKVIPPEPSFPQDEIDLSGPKTGEERL